MMLPALLLIAFVAVLAAVLRGFGGKRDDTTPAPGSADDDDESTASVVDADDLEVDDEGRVEAAAVTSDGWAFVPRGSGLELVPPGEDEDLMEQAKHAGSEAIQQAYTKAPLNPHTGKRLVFWTPGEHIRSGDMIAARVVRGAPGVDPWRLEALGRDYDYRPFAFETEEAARVALELVDARIVRAPRDEHGDAIPVGAEDFAVARRQHDETEQALAMDQDPDDDHDTGAPRR